jgi:heptosyltransferase-2
MKILVRLPNWLGDMVMASAFTNALAARYPGAEIHAIVKKELEGLVPFMEGVSASYAFSKKDFPGLMGAYRFGKQFREKAFDIFFCLPDSFSAAVMAKASGAKQRVGYSKEARAFLLTHSYKKESEVHRVDEYLGLLRRYSGQPVAEKKVGLRRPSLAKAPDRVLINFNSEASSRRMPVNKSRSILQHLHTSFPAITFGLIGSANDRPLIASILSGLPAGIASDLSGTTLAQLAGLLAGAAALVSTDSGPAHLANSLGIPVIALFGAGNELNTAPFNNHQLHVLRAGKLVCEPCLRNKCMLYDLPECMNLLDEKQIIRYLKLYLPDA